MKTWRAKKIYVDAETGEKLEEQEAKRNYIIIRTIKKTYTNKYYGTNEYTYICERNRQLGIFQES